MLFTTLSWPFHNPALAADCIARKWKYRTVESSLHSFNSKGNIKNNRMCKMFCIKSSTDLEWWAICICRPRCGRRVKSLKNAYIIARRFDFCYFLNDREMKSEIKCSYPNHMKTERVKLNKLFNELLKDKKSKQILTDF